MDLWKLEFSLHIKMLGDIPDNGIFLEKGIYSLEFKCCPDNKPFYHNDFGTNIIKYMKNDTLITYKSSSYTMKDLYFYNIYHYYFKKKYMTTYDNNHELIINYCKKTKGPILKDFLCKSYIFDKCIVDNLTDYEIAILLIDTMLII